MDLLLLDTKFQTLKIIDEYESLIWVDRYFTCGEFELKMPATNENIAFLQKDFYLWSSESEHLMVIETREVTADPEEGNQLLVKGRSVESILSRRIVWKYTSLNSTLQTAIEKLLNENLISPYDSKRKIEGFVFKRVSDPYVDSVKVNTSFRGGDLLTVISKLCTENGIGFKVVLTDKNIFELSLYSGTNRSYDQMENPFVVFSPTFENVLNSSFLESTKTMKTITLIGGYGEKNDRYTIEYGNTEITGLSRREIFTDARDLFKDDADYEEQLKNRGLETLTENNYIQTFEGKVDPISLFVYGKDFFMGDIVQVVNEFGIESKSRITETIRSVDKRSDELYPTFSSV